MRFHTIGVAFSGCSVLCTPIIRSPAYPALDRRSPQPQHQGLVANVLGQLNDIVESPVESILSDFRLVQATAAPIAISAASRTLSEALHATPTPSNIVALAGNLVAAGLTADNVEGVVDFATGQLNGENSFNNMNLRLSKTVVYPKAKAGDVAYSLKEAQLRAAIHIPSSFQYGRKGAPIPVILVPGTGGTGYTTFVGNYIPLLQGSKIADPVWLNIPGFLNDDAQVNAEYVAYAINYIHGISQKRKIAVVSWSQGGLNTQWALKFWPSTRTKIEDWIAFSPDYKGTIQANLIDINEPLPPSVLQQGYLSNFIKTLRANGGDSAYVPTTTVYSGFFDEIVEPQQETNASAYLLDTRHIGVSNNEVQAVCPGQPASSFYTHEGVLYNPIGFALLVDALNHAGPGKVSRLDLSSICGNYLTPGLDLADFLLTENTVLTAAVTILLNEPKVLQEPPIKAYAKRG